MAYEHDFDELMPHSVVRSAYSSISGYGKVTYAATSSTYSARVINKQRLVRSFDGLEKMSSVTAWVASTGSISPKDKVKLPDGTSPPILAIESFPDDDGNHHIKIAFA